MHRLFFDIISSGGVLYDFIGQSFRRVSDARQMAELIALDIACKESGDSSPSQRSVVEVRDVHGAKVLTVPVQEAAF
jgi:hypothetical protein